MNLLGCQRNNGIFSSSISSRNVAFYVIAAVVATLVIGAVVYSSRRKDQSDLDEHLMSGAAGAALAGAFEESPVWLAPTEPPAQFEPSNVAANGGTPAPLGTGATAIGGMMYLTMGGPAANSSSSSEGDAPPTWLAPADINIT
jgi:hypothetical protein